MNKLVVFGSNGLLGQSIVERFKNRYDLYAASRGAENKSSLADERYTSVDMSNRAGMKDFLDRHRPDIIVNAAAYTDVDGCEKDPEGCWASNVRAVENIIDSCVGFEPVLVQVSTDYVFDGHEGNYTEKDEPRPSGNYARSKLAAEKIVEQCPFQHIIARTQVLYGYGKDLKHNFATWVISRLSSAKNIRVVTDQTGNPTYVDDLSESIYRLLERREYGLFHVSGSETVSRYDFALKIADVFGFDAGLIEQITSDQLQQLAPRPMNSSFVIDKLVNRIDWEPGDVPSGLQRLKIRLVDSHG
ncbi:MAG TPA: dTDP-4-dehydrorhamnose reductase [Caldithrix abyssi]|uniref:dTDP-4-dehydrorhamnose reductase n=1 Tax=Caldithrix abyssi TaxID=187145 RepID=A0A7V1LPD1_CALAY|nr:dTDP-4-dehydrorhamnose reductase [Caldithrix abyssi]